MKQKKSIITMTCAFVLLSAFAGGSAQAGCPDGYKTDPGNDYICEEPPSGDAPWSPPIESDDGGPVAPPPETTLVCEDDDATCPSGERPSWSDGGSSCDSANASPTGHCGDMWNTVSPLSGRYTGSALYICREGVWELEFAACEKVKGCSSGSFRASWSGSDGSSCGATADPGSSDFVPEGGYFIVDNDESGSVGRIKYVCKDEKWKKSTSSCKLDPPPPPKP